MKMTKAVVAAGLAVLLGAGTASAVEGPNVGKWSVGPQLMEVGGIWAPGLSTRYWVNNEFGLEASVNYGTDTDKYSGGGAYEESESTLLGSVKVLYAPIVNDNSRFYVALEGGLGTYSEETDGVDSDEEDYYLVKPLVGTEFNFSEFKQIGFNVEIGYTFAGTDNDNEFNNWKESLSGITVGGGMHYYF